MKVQYTNKVTLTIVLLTAISLWGQSPQPLPQSFLDCIDYNGSGPCSLPSGIYSVPSTLYIKRDNVTITGVPNAINEVVLRRTSNQVFDMIRSDGARYNVKLEWLTIDGNRQGVGLGLSCLPANAAYFDVNFSGSSSMIDVNHVAFINSPGDSLILDGYASTVSYSLFGQGYSGHSITLNANYTGARSTAIKLRGNYSGAYYNQIAYAGTAAINFYDGSNQTAYGNTLHNNRYEQPDNVSGGQIYVYSGASTYTTSAANTINGNYWRTSSLSTSPSGCPISGGLYSFGVEADGIGHRFYNNHILQNLAWGMLIRNASSITISGTDPWCPSCTAKFIENNGGCKNAYGCYSGWPAQYSMAGININNYVGPVYNFTLDQIRVRNNQTFGVYIYGATGSPGYTNGACLINNTSSAPGSSSQYQNPSPLSPCP